MGMAEYRDNHGETTVMETMSTVVPWGWVTSHRVTVRKGPNADGKTAVTSTSFERIFSLARRTLKEIQAMLSSDSVEGLLSLNHLHGL